MNIKPLNNYVLVKVKQTNSKVKLEGGQIIYLDTSYQKEKHSDVVCEVVAVPDKLIYGFTSDTKEGRPVHKVNSMDWKTEMELRVGDTVIVHYMAYITAFGDDKRAFLLDGNEYFFVHYEKIFLAKRRWTPTEEDVFWKINEGKTPSEDWKIENQVVFDDKEIYTVIMLNGYILTQPIEKEIKSKFLILPETVKNTNKKLVKVCFAGSCNQEYIARDKNGYQVYNDAEVRPADVIIVEKSCDVPLEYHPTFNGDVEYWRMQRNNVKALVLNYDAKMDFEYIKTAN